MSNNQHELVQHCIDSAEFVTVKLSNHYLLFHENIIKHSTNQQLDLGKYFSKIIKCIDIFCLF